VQALEDRADEGRLAGRVDVVRAAADRRGQGRLAEAREWTDGRDQHVAAPQELGQAARAHHVGDGAGQAAKIGRQRLDALARARRQQWPRPTFYERSRRQLAGEARGPEQHDASGHRRTVLRGGARTDPATAGRRAPIGCCRWTNGFWPRG